MQTVSDILEYANDVYQVQRFDPDFDWRKAVNHLVGSDMFTATQAGIITGISRGHVQKHLREENGKTGKRTRAGVAGKFNPDSLLKIQLVQAKVYAREKRNRLTSDVREMVKDIVDEGTGASLIAHLTGVPVQTVRNIGAGHKDG